MAKVLSLAPATFPRVSLVTELYPIPATLRTRALATSVASSCMAAHSQVISWLITDPEAMAWCHLSAESASLPQHSAPLYSSHSAVQTQSLPVMKGMEVSSVLRPEVSSRLRKFQPWSRTGSRTSPPAPAGCLEPRGRLKDPPQRHLKLYGNRFGEEWRHVLLQGAELLGCTEQQGRPEGSVETLYLLYKTFYNS